MRPVRRGVAPQASDFNNYRDAIGPLISRLGGYCSYCERRIAAPLAVEHIQPKGLLPYKHLVGRWTNFLLGCVNCNSTKQDKDVDPADVLLPDRDNTFIAFHYEKDGTVRPSPEASPAAQALAVKTLSLVGLDKPLSEIHDENGKLVAIDRVAQRMEAWLTAEEAKKSVAINPVNDAVLQCVVQLAKATGFFSIWMSVFVGNATVRGALLAAFPGTVGSGCFDLVTTLPVSPAPNPDGLPGGSKA